MAKSIGVAGHSGHGKTALIRALTGVLVEAVPAEKRPGPTTDVGFSYVDLPEGGRVSVIDVPGDEKLVAVAIMGILGFDAALVCVAADEGVQPQTEEHWQILQSLGFERCVVALTRCDLADEGQKQAATAQAKELFGNVPIIEVSASTGDGLPALKEQLVKSLAATPDRSNEGPWFMPIDRAFVVKGQGLVVTGTLARGTVRESEIALLQPDQREVRIRSIQSHGQPAAKSTGGSRTALSLGGVDPDEVERGMVLGKAGSVFESSVLDVDLKWHEMPKHGSRVRVSIGAQEALGRIILPHQLADEEPSVETAHDAQLRLESNVACAVGQPLVVRRYSPSTLLAGGTVTTPQAAIRRRGDAKQQKAAANPVEAILATVEDKPNGVPTEEICRLLGKTSQDIGDLIEDLRQQQKLVGFAGLWFSPDGFRAGVRKLLEALEAMHEAHPKIAAHPRDRVAKRAGLTWSEKPLDRILTTLQQGRKLVVHGNNIRSTKFEFALTDRQRAFLGRVVEAIKAEPINVPNPHQLSLQLHVPIQAVEEILKLGADAGELVPLGDGVWYTPAQLDDLRRKIEKIAGGRAFSTSQVRDGLGTTRKYVIPILGWLDDQGITLRSDESRIFRSARR